MLFPPARSRDLTWEDVGELRGFLLSTSADAGRLLPWPWQPAWGSDAAAECANTEQGSAGPWGDEPVRSVYAGCALYVDTMVRCLETPWDVLGPDTTPYVLQALARAAMEAAAVLVYLLEPGRVGE